MVRPYTFSSCKVSVYDLGISISWSKIDIYNIVNTSLLLAAMSPRPALLYLHMWIGLLQYAQCFEQENLQFLLFWNVK